MRTSKFVTISLLPELLEEAEKLAKAEKRTRSEFFRRPSAAILRRKMGADLPLRAYGCMKAQEQDLTEADVERLVDENRAEQMNVKSGT